MKSVKLILRELIEKLEETDKAIIQKSDEHQQAALQLSKLNSTKANLEIEIINNLLSSSTMTNGRPSAVYGGKIYEARKSANGIDYLSVLSDVIILDGGHSDG